MASAWIATQWSLPEVDGLAPRVDRYDSDRFMWWLHDHGLPEDVNTVVAYDSAPTLQEAQDACAAALATVLDERAMVDAMVAEGAPEQPGQVVACG